MKSLMWGALALAVVGCGSDPVQEEDGFGLAEDNADVAAPAEEPLKLPKEGHVPHTPDGEKNHPPADGEDFQPVSTPIVPEGGGVSWEGHKSTINDKGQRRNAKLLGRQPTANTKHAPAVGKDSELTLDE